MKIVVLDGYTLNPGDLSWEGLEAIGECRIYDRTPAEKTAERCAGAEVVLTNKTVLSAELINGLPGLKYIGVLATGYNVVDIEAAKRRNIPVTNIPIYGTTSVAQMVFAHLLNLTQRVAYHAETVAQGKWSAGVDFCYWDYPLIELDGLVLGILGYGRIGQATGALAKAFGMRVIAHDPIAEKNGVSCDHYCTLEELFTGSDVVSLHCPLFPETQGIVNKSNLALMKPSAFLINTSRGPLVVEEDLAEALNHGKLAGAGLDVVSSEPIKADNVLLKAKNCYITPHIAWATRSARSRLMNTAVENAAAFIRGQIINCVWK